MWTKEPSRFRILRLVCVGLPFRLMPLTAQQSMTYLFSVQTTIFFLLLCYRWWREQRPLSPTCWSPPSTSERPSAATRVHSFKNDPIKIQTNASWIAGTERLLSLKTPTCVLLNPSKQFDSFGFEAENKFVDLANNKKHYGWMFFQKFKMILHNKELHWILVKFIDVTTFKFNVKAFHQINYL